MNHHTFAFEVTTMLVLNLNGPGRSSIPVFQMPRPERSDERLHVLLHALQTACCDLRLRFPLGPCHRFEKDSSTFPPQRLARRSPPLPAPMAATLDRWKGLPRGALRKVLAHVPCEADRTSVALACRSWMEALAPLQDKDDPLPLPPQLPWLLLPLPGGPAFSCLYRGGDASGIHRIRVPDDARSARYFGSYDGRWLFVATTSTRTRYMIADDHVLLNLRTGARCSVPREFRPELFCFRPSQPAASRVMSVLVATLSSAPDGDRCVGAAIVLCAPFDDRSRRQITFWRMGHQLAMPPSDLMAGGEPEDVVYHDGAFLFLTAGEHLFVCRPVFGQNGVLQSVDKGLRFIQQHEYREYDQQPHVRYLVESRGELLMVVKSSPGWTWSEGRWSRTWTFTVFRMTQRQMLHPGHMLYAWTMVSALDGRTLFVGHGSSRSYEVADFPGFQDGIYFLDDKNNYNLGRINQNEPYTCSDNGKWSRLLPVIDRCFQLDEGTSNYSPPVWLLP
ncbi:hypothetical protein BS78_09G133600 [Paspalum vaginatum]|nr:hypothetical protein BS78_09G133600 [Paspalum vaginatum]